MSGGRPNSLLAPRAASTHWRVLAAFLTTTTVRDSCSTEPSYVRSYATEARGGHDAVPAEGDGSLRLLGMDPAQRKALQTARRAQARFDQAQERLDAAAVARREGFAQAAAAGLSMAEIGEAVGLHRSRVNQIIHGK